MTHGSFSSLGVVIPCINSLCNAVVIVLPRQSDIRIAASCGRDPRDHRTVISAPILKPSPARGAVIVGEVTERFTAPSPPLAGARRMTVNGTSTGGVPRKIKCNRYLPGNTATFGHAESEQDNV